METGWKPLPKINGGSNEALARGRITVVEPLTSTSALWGVTLAAVVLRRHEAIGLRLLVAATCVVIGGALIGVYR